MSTAGAPRLTRSRLRDLRAGDWARILIAAVKSAFADRVPMLASALAYSSFFVIPSVLLIVVGLFTLIASPSGIDDALGTLRGAVPAAALSLFASSLHQLNRTRHTGVLIVVVGTLVALWSLTSAMSNFMTAITLAYDQHDRRSFLRRRVVALKLALCFVLALAVVGALLVLGPTVSAWIGRRTDSSSAVNWLWWALEWPLLVGTLLALLTTMLLLAPDQRPSWQDLIPGALVATVIWIIVSGLFALYTGTFHTFNKTWGSLSAVIVTLIWFWLTALALLLGAEVNAETERYAQAREESRGFDHVAD